MSRERAQPSTSRPLDDGPRGGPELWRTLNGIEFCHWDRWLLRLSLAEGDGLESIEATFRGRASRRPGSDESAEAMVAQVRDLKRRLNLLGGSAQPLDAEEQASEWLFKKAWKRVWHDGPHQRTPAMLATPRRLLERRALRGAWPAFPVCPAEFEPALRSVVGTDGFIDYRLVGTVARGLELEVELLAFSARGPSDRLALYRAALTVIIEVMNRADDSLAEMAEAFRGFELRYLELAREFLEHPVVLRDAIELFVWEDYGLVDGVEQFVRTLPIQHAQRALQELHRVIEELRAEGLDYEMSKAINLRSTMLS